MGIKYSMEGFIKYLKINTMGNSKRRFTHHSASGRSLKLHSVITIADDNMQDKHCSCIANASFASQCFSMVLKPKDVRVPCPEQLILDCHWLVCARGEGLTDK